MTGLVVITRPIEDAHEYAQELQQMGFETFIEPMLSIVPVVFSVPDISQYDGVLVTSANAMQAYQRGGGIVDANKKVFCVGKHTAAAAREAGFEDVFSVDGTGADLLLYVLALPDARSQRFLHICGDHVAFPLADRLREASVRADSLVVYKSLQVSDISPEFRAVLEKGEVAAVTFFSKRTAEAFARLFVGGDSESMLAGIKSLSISAPVLECVRVLPWRSSHVSTTPDRAGMMQVLKAYVHES